MAPIPKLNQPICLIENEPGKKICLNQEAKQILEKISQPLVVVSIVGPYRSGKSYLMNKLAGVKTGGFPLGHTVQAKTKGIWMWCVPHPDKSARTLVLLDTEGLGDVHKGDKRNDSAILSLTLLLSSALVYNSIGTIDEDAVKTLYDTSELSECIMSRSSFEEGDLVDSPFTPLFVWAVRNFSLKMVLEGRAATADEYLENSLKEISSVTTPVAERRNFFRTTLRTRFPVRKCFTFEVPSTDNDKICNLENVPEKQLSPEFVEMMETFCQYIYKKAEAKMLEGGQVVTGCILGQLANSYIKAVTTKCIASLEHSITKIFLDENNSIIKSSTELYKGKIMSRSFDTLQEFQTFHESCLNEALTHFKEKYFKYRTVQDQSEHQLMETIEKQKEEVWKTLEVSSEKKCRKILDRLFEPIIKAQEQNKYHVAGGHNIFVKARDEIVKKFHVEPGKGVKAESVLQDFLKKNLEPMETIICQTDNNLSEKIQPPLKVHDPSDPTQLTNYIKGYKLKYQPYHRILIQLFGFAGHGKSSFVNSCMFALGGGHFNDVAGEGSSYGAKTTDRIGHKLTDCITIVDNRGFGKMDSSEAWHIYAQLCNIVPLNQIVVWNTSSTEKMQQLIQAVSAPDLIVPVFVCSSSYSCDKANSELIKTFLKNAQFLTEILPFIILTKKNSGKDQTETFKQMGMEQIYRLENYILTNKMATRGNHMPFLTFLKDVLDWVDYIYRRSVNFEEQQLKRKTFLIKNMT
ncbi:guanylate binding protein 4 S homeolog isoform X1 [Xenopus laevis]|uniref:GB1/RHD3-type G domain-containing protein n=2 Tax=Xenopus laevis TaxID=8355 RepID=A0A974H207_XENLA|nr:guanylate binding protein 4 S homeolog isoform X1 [Xenopus laevis]OCT61922.1 hypothetical protein XELAEV_18047956mg [Xenopus laevis]OCT61923.1 hypothetical protein XELAEV_18047956mg [Xenopus laevis]